MPLFIFAILGLFSTHVAFRYLFGLTQSISDLLNEKYTSRQTSSPIAKLGAGIFGDYAGWLLFIIMAASIIYAAFWVFTFAVSITEKKVTAFAVVLVVYGLISTQALQEWHAKNYRAPEFVRDMQRTKEQQEINREAEEYLLGSSTSKSTIIIEGLRGNESAKLVAEVTGSSSSEKIAEGLYRIKTSGATLDVKVEGKEDIGFKLKELFNQLKIDQPSDDYVYTDGRAVLYRDGQLPMYCIPESTGECTISGQKWDVKVDKECGCFEYSTKQPALGAGGREYGSVCKNSSPASCSKERRIGFEFSDFGVQYRMNSVRRYDK